MERELAGQGFDYQLTDRYTLNSGRVYLTGSQALVRLPLMQRHRDRLAGLNTAGFISGYTGSPLGGYDIALKQVLPLLRQNGIVFRPGLNEDLAATSVWGSQQTHLIDGANVEGVFGIWYGKGPGVDRSGDALKHGSYAGSSAKGGVLVLAGDDHGAKSSTTAHQSDQAFIHFGMPYLNPANVQDYLDLGLHGFAMSRFSGCWIGMKCITDTVESSASVYVDPDRVRIVVPVAHRLPPAGLNLRWGVPALEAEARHYQQRLPAIMAYVLANGLDREVIANPLRRLGVIASGKAFLDVMQALEELGLDADHCKRLGLSVYKVAMPWPLEPSRAQAFAVSHQEVVVVEEKRPVIEDQLAKLLFNLARRPVLVGKRDEYGQPLISSEGELVPRVIALILGERLLRLTSDPYCATRVSLLREKMQLPATLPGVLKRLPSFCAGCPHNTSTNVPQGSMAFGGIGCHGMATFLPERNTPTLFQMGGEGAPWIGIAPFTKTKHIFQNLGDGTYFHSGILAIRAAVAAGVNITYKILVNDAIAMTGGQTIEGQVQVKHLVEQIHAEGVNRIAVVSDKPDHYGDVARFGTQVTFHHRDHLDGVQRELRDLPGVTAIIYDQHCATELRRRRKRGSIPDPDRRTFINERVCEGCGDCGVQSNCIAVEPIETEFGRKRRINQSACNKDFSCLKGYCPSFVSVYGGRPRSRGGAASAGFDVVARAATLPAPLSADITETFNILVTGIGGSGVVTLGALIGVAAHLEGKGCSVLDMSGLAQRNGPVTSHIRISERPEHLFANRIAVADLIVGSDIVVTSGRDILAKIGSHTRAIVNSHVAPTSEFATNPDIDLSSLRLQQAITSEADTGNIEFVEATELATTLLGNEVGANLFLVGFALQRGWMPVSHAALVRAIELNGVSVDLNKAALAWGRLAAHDLNVVRVSAGVADGSEGVTNGGSGVMGDRHDAAASDSLEDIERRHKTELTAYQNAAYAQRYGALVDRVKDREAAIGCVDRDLSTAVARSFFKLLAYKDEYEVARLYSDPKFLQRLRGEFEGDFKIEINMAPPIFQRRDPRTGRYRKYAFGAWMLPILKLLQRGKCLRGTSFDLFGYTQHRREERSLIREYESAIEQVLGALTPATHRIAVEIAKIPEQIRGYDIVKELSIGRARARQRELLTSFHAEPRP
jgi:indolepyruvate ferredoxin oxidoreductase